MDYKLYATTSAAGFVVAGRRIPAVYVEGKEPTPQVGYELYLTDDEAAYELAQGTVAALKQIGAIKNALKPVQRVAE